MPRDGVIEGSAGTAADGSPKPRSRSMEAVVLAGIDPMVEPGMVKGYGVVPGPLGLKIGGPGASGERRTIISRWKLMRASWVLVRPRRMDRNTAKRAAMSTVAPMVPLTIAGTLIFRSCDVEL